MNRQEAYNLISERLQQLADLGFAQLNTKISSELIEYSKGETGTNYQMSFKLKGNRLDGSIHESGSQNFVLLEESIDVSS